MSGICGFASINDDILLARMTECLSHRGPDDLGYYQANGVSFGHRQLEILDLMGDKQPMSNEDGSITIVFNGKIYNYRELRHSLESRGHIFRTASDTEVLLRMFEVEGPRALQKLNGMFAFAIHDRRRDELFLARDRIGIKPLYFLDLPGRFLFASEMKALLAYSDWTPTISPQAINDYLALRYVPGNGTMFAEIKRLPAGHYLIYRNGRAAVQRYWEPPEFSGPYYRNEDSYSEEFAELMELSVSRRMISDVPYGAYLSGSLNSSVIVALMAKFAFEPVKTYNVDFNGAHDEVSEAAKAARLLGSEHHEITCRASDMSKLPEIVYCMDEPHGDPIALPMFMLAEEAKRNVKVILTSEGGDEIFGGYPYQKTMRMGDVYRRMVPASVRNQVFTPILSKLPASLLNAALHYPPVLGKSGKLRALDYLQLLEPDQINEAYRHQLSLYEVRGNSSLYSPDFRARLTSSNVPNGEVNPSLDLPYINRLLLLQFWDWLPDNLLLRQDKTGMAHGIESRVPFLDHELVEFVLRLPPRLRLHNLTDKYILRSYARELLPTPLSRRKRVQLSVPIEDYSRQPDFQEMMNDLLSDNSTRSRGIYQVEAIARLRKSIQRNEIAHVKQAFNLMVLELWFRIFYDRTRTV